MRSADAEREPLGEPDVLDRAHHADVHVGVEERRVLGGDDDVGVDDEVQPGPGDHAVHGA